MKFKHGDHKHEVFLLDDGTLDTVISVDGKEQRYSQEFASGFRNRWGGMTFGGLRAMAEDACDAGLLEC